MPQVLLVEDDPTVSEVVQTYLERAGFVVRGVEDGATALEVAETMAPDLIVLDVMLPGLDGIEVCRRLRARSDVPIVMLTAMGTEMDRVLGLEVGADDYVTKPFSPRELVLRIQSVLRRTQGGSMPATSTGPETAPEQTVPAAPECIVDGDLRVQPLARRAQLSGRELSLTMREFDLLNHLVAHPGIAFSREELMHVVWGWEFGDLSTVTVHVRRLRAKVEADPARPDRLTTVWGVGYRWNEANVS